jgi:lysozyme
MCQQSALLRTCASAASIHGVDVSKYDGMVDWAQAETAGIRFAFARVSDGTANPDAYFATNWHGMQANGIVRGAYQYFRASVDPSAQANLVVTSLRNAGGLSADDLPVVMDIETADGQSETTIETNMRTWLAAIEGQTGRTPIIYTSSGTYPVNMTAFAAYPLWVANYGASCPSMPVGWSTWRFWQYSSTGSVNGIANSADLDEFNGTLAELMAFGGGAPSDSGVPPGAGDGSDRGMEAGPPAGMGALEPDGEAPGPSDDGGGSAMGKAGEAPRAFDASMMAADAESNPCGP